MSETNWEGTLSGQRHALGKGRLSPGLVDFLASHPGLERGTVLVPGCGTGHDVRAWDRAGFAAVGCDIAPTAICLAKERTEAERLAATFHQGDFLADKPQRRFDWVFEHTLFCAIAPSRRDDYLQALLRWLKPDGQYLAVNYLIPDQDGPPFGTTRTELWERFSPPFELLQEWVPRSYPNRAGLDLMLWWKRRKQERTNP